MVYGLASLNTPETIAAALALAFHNDTAAPADAVASGATITFTARSIGTATNYPIAASAASGDPNTYGQSFSFAAGSATALSGGRDAGTSPDTGTVTITVNGTPYATTYGGSDTATTIASRLAASIGSGSWASASASGGAVNLTAKTTGAGGDYSLAAASTYDSAHFGHASFTATASGSVMTGGYSVTDFDNHPYVTLYRYDALGNLLCVEQHGNAHGPNDTGCGAPPSADAGSSWRVRRFTYDSLGRLLTANNPESGQIGYQYDLDGNLLQKTSPAPNQTGAATQTISYCYDALHRVTGKAYAAAACPLASPVVSYVYDQGVNGIGHLTSLTDQAGSASYVYDVLGRLVTETRVIAGVGKTVSYGYNLDGSLQALHYPSGAVVTYTPDSAGRTISAVDIANAINYVTGASYGPDGALTGFISGNSAGFAGITNKFFYTPRLQPCRMLAGIGTLPGSCADTTVQAGTLDLTYDFHYGSGNNGNLWGIANNRDGTRNQSFTYDVLNRLASASNAGTDCNLKPINPNQTKFWGNTYGYDAWGNLLSKTPTRCNAENLALIPNLWNRADNGLPALQNYGYDAAGNMTFDVTDGVTSTYDAENRISTASKNGVTTAYVYDTDGNRVKKTNASSGTLYWYMTPGIVAESDQAGTLTSEYVFFGGERVARRDLVTPTGVFYYFSDHLKTASVVADATGNIKAESDYYPWGGELQFVNADSNHYKFTGKERDAESGLDYFGARYYSNGLSRFVSADWSAAPIPVPYANFNDPQSLNLYRYPSNPETYTDTDGHCGDWCQKLWNGIRGNGFKTDAELRQQPQDGKQALVDAQDDARKNPHFQHNADGVPNHCNQATCAIAKAVGAPLGPLTEKDGKTALKATAEAKNLTKSSAYKEVTPKEAQALANQGKLVIAAYANPDPKHSGHLATVRPEGVSTDQIHPNSRGPLINNIGTSVGIMGQNYAYGKLEVHYYTPK